MDKFVEQGSRYNGYDIYTDAGRVYLRLGDGTNDPARPAIGIFEASTTRDRWDANTWYYIVATYDGLAINLYVDGVLDSSLNVGNRTIATNDRNLLIGVADIDTRTGDLNARLDRFTNATLDEMTITRNAIDAAEVRNNYCAIKALAAAKPPPAPPDPLPASCTE